MRPWGDLEKATLGFNEIVKPENKDLFYIVEYDDLVNNPQEIMDGIYDFIGIKKFKHNFKKIVKLENDNDTMLRLPEDLHRIRPELKQTSAKPEDVLSDYVLRKYSNMEFWRN
jgi:sulfotransferase